VTATHEESLVQDSLYMTDQKDQDGNPYAGHIAIANDASVDYNDVGFSAKIHGENCS